MSEVELDVVPVRDLVVADPHRHHDFLERGVAGALADAVDGALDLPRAGADAGERVGDRHAEIIVAVHGEARLVGVRHGLAKPLEHVEIFFGYRVAHGVREIDRGGAGVDRGFDAAAEKVELGAGGVFSGPLDVVDVIARPRHRRDHHLVDLLWLHLQLVLHVHRRRGQEGVDAAALRVLDSFAAAIDVLQRGARQAADHRVLGALGDLAHRLEIAVGGEGIARFDDVDPHVVEQLGDLELFLEGHGGAGALLAVAQGGVKNIDAVLVGLGGGGHEVLWSVVAAEGRSGSGDLVNP